MIDVRQRLGLAALAIHVLAAGQGPLELRPGAGASHRTIDSPSPLTRPGVFRIRTDLVLVPVTVVDRQDHFVDGLQADDFRLFADRAERPIVSLTQEDAPVSVALVLDLSGSMKNLKPLMQAALRKVLERSGPTDEYLVVAAQDRPALITPFTHSANAIEDALGHIQPGGWTPLFDAIVLAAQELKRGHNKRKVLLVISDADDNHSRYSDRDVDKLLREIDLRMFVVGLPCLCGSDSGPAAAPALEDMAQESGGRYVSVGSVKDLPKRLEQLDFRNLYIVGFQPGGLPADGRYHEVRVEVAKTKLPKRGRVYWRRGFLAPDI